jgi:signal peptidase I
MVEAKSKTDGTRPTAKQIEEELIRLNTGKELKKAVSGTIKNLIVIAAAAVLVSNLLLSFMSVSRSSMSPTLKDGEVVIAVRWLGVNPGDIIAFHYNNKILVKRVIAQAGDRVFIDENGQVYVNNELLDEPYLNGQGKSLGECDIEMPYQVPDGCVFVMGDQREVSADSRQKEIGAVKTELIIGKVFLRIWPLSDIGLPK